MKQAGFLSLLLTWLLLVAAVLISDARGLRPRVRRLKMSAVKGRGGKGTGKSSKGSSESMSKRHSSPSNKKEAMRKKKNSSATNSSSSSSTSSSLVRKRKIMPDAKGIYTAG